MHVHFEKSINAKCDCTILCMSWMGKVPEELPEDEGWKLNRTHYYQEGWLATGNVRGILGVTFTTSHWRKNSSEMPHRTNYNLRGHRAQITFVQWNEPYQKLASCDSSGIIFVWIKYEGRWSIELINDRNTPVTHFSWSHDGRMALICYQDGFVLVGSVAGQRYWSNLLNLECTITCGIWTPDDQQVYFGTSNAQVIIMDMQGNVVSQVQLPVDSSIRSMAWSCEKFKMEENDESEPPPTSASGNLHEGGGGNHGNGHGHGHGVGGGGGGGSHFSSKRELFLLAVSFKNGLVYLMKNYDDISPIHIWTGMQGLIMEWSNSGEFLAIAGSRPVEVINEAGYRVHEYFNSLYFYNHRGVRVLNIVIPASQSPVTALTWGHNDKRLFVATGKMIHVGWVSKRVASLQLLCRLAIYKSLSNKSCVAHLPLPLPVRALISSLHTQTIMSLVPNLEDLREFVSHPPSGNLRLYCTMIRHDEDANQSPGTAYTLYLEYLGGLIPILKGKRTSKIRPEFVIFDPQSSDSGNYSLLVRCGGGSGGQGGSTTGYSRHQSGGSSNRQSQSQQSCDTNVVHGNGRASPTNNNRSTNCPDLAPPSIIAFSDSSESEDVELCASPHMQRRRYRHRVRERERERQREREREWERSRYNGQPIIPDPASLLVNPQHLIYHDILPEAQRLVEVTSNIWGTKFKIHGLAMSLPENLGQVTYKTSLLHLQPRQMTLLITELRDDIFLSPESFLHSSFGGMGGVGSGGRGGSVQNNTNYHEEDEAMTVIVNNDGKTTTTNNSLSNSHYSPPTGCGSGNGSNRRGSGSDSCSSSSGFGIGGSSNISSAVGSGPSSASPKPINPSFRDTPKETDEDQFNSIILNLNRDKSIRNPEPSSAPGSGSADPDTDQDEFPYVDLQANPEMIHFRQCLKNSLLKYDSEFGPDRFKNGHCYCSHSAISDTNTNTTSTMCQTHSSCSNSNNVNNPLEECTTPISEESHPHPEAHKNTSNSTAGTTTVTTRAQIEPACSSSSSSSGNSRQGQGKSVPGPSTPLKSIISEPVQNSPISAGPRGRNRVWMWTTPNESNEGVSAPHASNSSSHALNVRRSLSASFLDDVEQPGQLTLDIVSQDLLHNSKPKRLVLVKKKQLPKGELGEDDGEGEGRSRDPEIPPKLRVTPRLKECGKSKSWDSYDFTWWKRHHSDGLSSGSSGAPGLGSNKGAIGRFSYTNDSATCPKCSFPVSKSKKPGHILGASGSPLPVRSNNLISVNGNSLLSSNSSIDPLLRGRNGPTNNNCNSIAYPATSTPIRRLSNLLYSSNGTSTSLAGPSSFRTCTTNNPSSNPYLPQTPKPLRKQQQKGGCSSNMDNFLSSKQQQEDRIESIAVQNLPISPPRTPSPSPPPAPTHRRSISLLTPLLKRRELAASRQRNNESGSRGVNHSSSFIPPGSPQHQPRSSPTTPASQRKSSKSRASNFLSSASSPFRQLFVNSPLLSRRRHQQNSADPSSQQQRNQIFGTPWSRRKQQQQQQTDQLNNSNPNNSPGNILDSSDDELMDESSGSQTQGRNPYAPFAAGVSAMTPGHHLFRSSAQSRLSNAGVSAQGSLRDSLTPPPNPASNDVGGGTNGGGCQRTPSQNSHLRQKLSKKKIHNVETSPVVPKRMEFVMHNKAPMWNENSQVYQLDFGGRVTQESAKNFQIEFRNKQVMQFGRIDGNAYTMDFQYPFSALQAFAVALANVTQRLK